MNLTTFDFNSMAVRVMDREGQPWFVAADVCRVLEIVNPTNAIRELDDDEKITLHNEKGNPRGGIPLQMNLISESGLYALVFKSRKPEAKAFRRWVTSDVLPAIRQTGGYALPVGGGEVLKADVVSVLSFVRECCAGWTLERQMGFGLLVRRYAKSMGVVFQTVEEPGVGRVFAFGRPVLEAVRSTMAPEQPVMLDAEAQELASLIKHLHAEHGDVVLRADEVRRAAVKMGLFPRVLKLKSEPARNSAFGCVVARYAGHLFPGGYVIENLRTASHRLYAIRREVPSMALTS